MSTEETNEEDRLMAFSNAYHVITFDEVFDMYQPFVSEQFDLQDSIFGFKVNKLISPSMNLKPVLWGTNTVKIRYLLFPMFTKENRPRYHAIFFVNMENVSVTKKFAKSLFAQCLKTLGKGKEELNWFKNLKPVTIFLTGNQKELIHNPKREDNQYTEKQYKNFKEYNIFFINTDDNIKRRSHYEVKININKTLYKFFNGSVEKLVQSVNNSYYIDRNGNKQSKHLFGQLKQEVERIRTLCNHLNTIDKEIKNNNSLEYIGKNPADNNNNLNINNKKENILNISNKNNNILNIKKNKEKYNWDEVKNRFYTDFVEKRLSNQSKNTLFTEYQNISWLEGRIQKAELNGAIIRETPKEMLKSFYQRIKEENKSLKQKNKKKNKNTIDVDNIKKIQKENQKMKNTKKGVQYQPMDPMDPHHQTVSKEQGLNYLDTIFSIKKNNNRNKEQSIKQKDKIKNIYKEPINQYNLETAAIKKILENTEKDKKQKEKRQKIRKKQEYERKLKEKDKKIQDGEW